MLEQVGLPHFKFILSRNLNLIFLEQWIPAFTGTCLILVGPRKAQMFSPSLTRLIRTQVYTDNSLPRNRSVSSRNALRDEALACDLTDTGHLRTV